MRKTSKVNEEIKTNEFVYCSQRKCIHTEWLIFKSEVRKRSLILGVIQNS